MQVIRIKEQYYIVRKSSAIKEHELDGQEQLAIGTVMRFDHWHVKISGIQVKSSLAIFQKI